MKKKEDKFNPLVSIVIPVYNGENYLKEAIDSALAQTYKNIEVIVVNDGSKDKTEDVAKSYGDSIRYFSKKNGGTSTALNLGIKNMKGDYFSWLSHDDQYYPDKIKRQVEELSKLENKNTIMMTDLDGINEKYEKIYETKYMNHIKEYPPREKCMLHPIIYNQTHGCTLLIPKKCFEECGLFDETSLVAQDFEFFYRAFSKFPHKLIPEVLVTARDSSNRQGRRSKVKGSIEYSELFIKIIEGFSDNDFKMLAPTKLKFYEDMLEFFNAAGYDKAYDYISSLVLKNLQVSSYDLVGNKFNGHDLHKYLREKGVLSNQIVLHKESDDINTYPFDFFGKNATKEFIKNKLFYETDIVHFHLIHNIIDLNYMPIITRLKPCVITLHDAYFLGGHCVHHFDCNNWKNICHDCPYLNELFPLDKDYSSLNFEINKVAIQNSQISVIVASDWMKSRVEKSPIWKGKKVYKLPFGIDTNKFMPTKDMNKLREELEIPKDNIVVMFRADSGSFKGTDIIKKALEKINNKNITLLVVGDIKQLAGLYGKYDVREYGWLRNDQLLLKLYQACDLFLMPSRYESFGMMAIEAMACEKPVLTINSAGSALPEIIEAPKYGLSVDEANFYDELKRLLSNKKELSKRGKECRKLVVEKYNKEKYINSMIEIYKDVINNYQFNEESELVINQLKQYMPYEAQIQESNEDGNVKKKLPKRPSFARCAYRKLPLSFRKKVKGYMLESDSEIIKELNKKIKFQ